jgi:[acyl-carrier-protein] S-malonyltransferase
MGKGLFDDYPIVRQLFEEGSDSLGMNLASFCFDTDLKEMTAIRNAGPAILTVGMAAYLCFKERYPDIAPHFLAGHSLGEYGALVAAGSLKYADAVRIVYKRGVFMEQVAGQKKSCMYVISGLMEDRIGDICGEVSSAACPVNIACYNAEMHVVISGALQAVQNAARLCEKAGAKATELASNVPSHTPLMKPAAVLFEKELSGYSFNPMNTKVISNTDALPYRSERDLPGRLAAHLTVPVRWKATMQYLLQENVFYFVDMGPGWMLKSLAKMSRQSDCFAFNEAGSMPAFAATIRKNIKQIPSVVTKCMTAAVTSRNFNRDQQSYREGVILPYRRLRELQEKLEGDGRLPDDREALLAIRWLDTILSTKGRATDEIHEIVSGLKSTLS